MGLADYYLKTVSLQKLKFLSLKGQSVPIWRGVLCLQKEAHHRLRLTVWDLPFLVSLGKWLETGRLQFQSPGQDWKDSQASMYDVSANISCSWRCRVHVCSICLHLPVRTHRKARDWCWHCHFYFSWPWVLRQGFPLSLDFELQTGSLVRDACEDLPNAHSTPLQWEMCSPHSFLPRCWGPTLGLHACSASTLVTKPSFQLQNLVALILVSLSWKGKGYQLQMNTS